ncbi:MAG TPA: hypothetical protein VN708_12170 [Terriglobales bacterium]|nr:hypothetical protein [Terriglobales bacterium]
MHSCCDGGIASEIYRYWVTASQWACGKKRVRLTKALCETILYSHGDVSDVFLAVGDKHIRHAARPYYSRAET